MTYGAVEYAGGPYAGGRAPTASADLQTSLAVEVAFTTAPLATPVWVDVTADVVSWQTARGRTRELERFQPGRATIVLNNLSRQYDSVNAAGPYYGNIKPMRRIRIRETFSGVTYPHFDGYVDRWQLDYPAGGKNATATVTATDGFKVFARTELPSVFVSEVKADAPVAWWRLGDPAYITTAPDQVGTADMTYISSPTVGDALVTNDPNRSTTFALANANVARRDGNSITAFPYTVEAVIKVTQTDTAFRLIYDNERNATPLNQADYFGVDDNASALPGRLIWTMNGGGGALRVIRSAARVDDNKVHHVVAVAVSGTETHLYIDGVEDTVISIGGTAVFGAGTYRTGLGNYPATLPSGNNLGLGGSLQDVVVYNYALSAARIQVHSDAVAHPWQADTPATRIGRVLDQSAWPSGSRDLEAGATTLQSASLVMSVLEHLQKIAETEFGLLFMSRDGNVRFVSRATVFARSAVSGALFGDAGGAEVGYRALAPDDGDEVLRNRATISRLDGVAKTASDATSMTNYGRFDYSLEGLFNQSDAHSASYAAFIVAEYKDLRRRITSLTVGPAAPGTESTLYPQMLGRELGEAVTVRHRPPGGGAMFEQVCAIEGITQTVDRSRKLRTTTFALSPDIAGSF